MSGFHLLGTRQLEILARRLDTAGDKGLRTRMSREFRKIGKPIAQEVLQQGSADMPRRGGLSEHLKRGKAGVRTSLGRSIRVSLTLKGDGYDLNPIDQGDLRHPVFGHRKTWVRQRVQPQAFTTAFDKQAPKVRKAVVAAAEGVARDVARGL